MSYAAKALNRAAPKNVSNLNKEILNKFGPIINELNNPISYNPTNPNNPPYKVFPQLIKLFLGAKYA